tara:strand:- start:202 stop:579 length:378 start_codon:yes stop_codon:yes gene_type:complete
MKIRAGLSAKDRRDLDLTARSIVEVCFRNTKIEDLHAGVFPQTASGDWSDVKVVTPFGEIAWNDLSRISDAEMRELMVETVNRVFTYAAYPEELSTLAGASRWDPAELDERLMRTVNRKRHGGGD